MIQSYKMSDQIETYVIPGCTLCHRKIELKEIRTVLIDSICWCHSCKKYVKINRYKEL